MTYGAPPPASLTDLYQLTMAQAYLDAGLADTEGCFHLFFRDNPFGSGFSVAAGLQQAVEWLTAFRYTEEEIDYLRAQRGADGRSLFSADFLAYLANTRFSGDVDAIAEGTVVFPREPLVRISGPLPVCQLVETTLLTIINYQTLVATKAARCRIAASNDSILEFGLRRAQGPDGGLSASRAAYIGGVDATSNVLAASRYGIPAAGTHAHSWVMAFPSEIDAFEAYARALPNNVTLLVDTYDTLQGVHNAVHVGREMQKRGEKLLGIRIDSGDLAWLSVQARRILDEAGFTDTRIVASNELDEHLIASLKEQGAAIDVWGVGTKLVTGDDDSALGGVYKLSAVRRPGEEWVPKVKVSEQIVKSTTPGIMQVRRYYRPDGSLAGDMIFDELHSPEHEAIMVDPADATRRKTFSDTHTAEELLEPVFRGGKCVWQAPELAAVRERALSQVARLDPATQRFVNPHVYPVGLERTLHDLQTALVLRAKGISLEDASPSPGALAEADALLRREDPS